MVLASLLLNLLACTAPAPTPTTDLAGSHLVGEGGPTVEEYKGTPPFSAWTAATPLTLVAPGGANLAILDRVGVRVEVAQVRKGRILVKCSGCAKSVQTQDGWLPLGVLWTLFPLPSEAPTDETDPLSLLMKLRSRWVAGMDLPPGGTADALCPLVDRGVELRDNQAVSTYAGGKITLTRVGASWNLTSVVPLPKAEPGSCG